MSKVLALCVKRAKTIKSKEKYSNKKSSEISLPSKLNRKLHIGKQCQLLESKIVEPIQFAGYRAIHD